MAKPPVEESREYSKILGLIIKHTETGGVDSAFLKEKMKISSLQNAGNRLVKIHKTLINDIIVEKGKGSTSDKYTFNKKNPQFKDALYTYLTRIPEKDYSEYSIETIYHSFYCAISLKNETMKQKMKNQNVSSFAYEEELWVVPKLLDIAYGSFDME